jgi:hypothetical protein
MEKIDPICGMKGRIPAYGHYFCSQKCIEKYKEGEAKRWYHEKLYTVGLLVIVILTCSFFFAQPFFYAFIDYLKSIWWAILLGFIVGGFIDYFVPREYIEKYLSRHRKRTIIYSIILGFLMSACSHGILAIAMELYKKGANTSSVIAFLLASPWANLPITIILFGFFGIKALFIVASALIIAMITGLIYQRLECHGIVECEQCIQGEDTPVLTDFSIIDDIKKRFKKYSFSKENNKAVAKGVFYGSWSLSKMVLWWLLIGMLIAAFARAYIPFHLFEHYMGPTLLGILVTLLFATIIEVCSEGSSPLAFEIYDKTMRAGTPAFGNSFIFLMAGVATDYTEIGLIWSNIGKKAALLLPIITIPHIVILGCLFNYFM